MLSKSIKVVSPRIFELYIEDINPKENECLVKVEKAAICKADIRYYEGEREERILGLKYPMNLLHEMSGKILKDKSGTFKSGEKVVLVPNIINKKKISKNDESVMNNEYFGENYCENAKFASSNMDGFARQVVAWPLNYVIRCPQKVSSNILVFSELISVCISAFRRVYDICSERIETVCVWGDGILGYIMCSLAKNIYNMKVIAVGKHEEKLKQFNCDEYIELKNIPNKFYKADVFIECVGGKGMKATINDILNIVKPGGKLVLTGVCENNIEINTRKILEKGITITGSTRSSYKDFNRVMKYFENESFSNSIEQLNLGNVDIENITDFYDVFEKTCNEKMLGKYILDFKF